VFKNLFRKISVFDGREHPLTYEDKFFSNIVGHSDIKKLLLKSVVSKEPVNVLLTGPPSSSKTVFVLEMRDALSNAYFVDATGATSAGMIDYLFGHDTKYLLIDEIDKMAMKDIEGLLTMMERGEFTSTKVRNTQKVKANVVIFATSNSTERLSKPLLSRFTVLKFQNILTKNLKE